MLDLGHSEAGPGFDLNPAVLRIRVDSDFHYLVNPLRSKTSKVINELQNNIVDAILAGRSVPTISSEFNVPEEGINLLVQKLTDMQIIGPRGCQFDEQPTVDRPNSMSIWLHTTDRCNLGCTYCYIPNIRQSNDFAPELFERLESKILESVAANGLSSVRLRLAGGEPFYKFRNWNKPIADMKKRLRERGINFHVGCLTNLTVLTDEMLDYVIENEIGLGVSLDGLGDVHDASRPFVGGKGSFDTVKTNLERVKSRSGKFNVMVVVSNSNIHQMPELTKFFVENDIPFRFSDVKGTEFDHTGFNAGLHDSFAVLERAIDDGFRFEQMYQLCDLNIGNVSRTACSMGSSGGAIYTDGRIYFCHTETGGENCVGSLEEKTELFEIFARGKHKQRPERHSDCEGCRYRQVCARGCPLYRDDNNKSPECAVYHDVLPEIFRLIGRQRVREIRLAGNASRPSVVNGSSSHAL